VVVVGDVLDTSSSLEQLTTYCSAGDVWSDNVDQSSASLAGGRGLPDEVPISASIVKRLNPPLVRLDIIRLHRRCVEIYQDLISHSNSHVTSELRSLLALLVLVKTVLAQIRSA